MDRAKTGRSMAAAAMVFSVFVLLGLAIYADRGLNFEAPFTERMKP